MKTCNQSILVTFPSSTLEFQAIGHVPVYELPQHGWVKIIYNIDSFTMVYSDGVCVRKYMNCDTGEMSGHSERWDCRPELHLVLKNRGNGGYFYQFHTDGSITSSWNNAHRYWGPVCSRDDTTDGLHTEIVPEYIISIHYGHCLEQYAAYTNMHMEWDDTNYDETYGRYGDYQIPAY